MMIPLLLLCIPLASAIVIWSFPAAFTGIFSKLFAGTQIISLLVIYVLHFYASTTTELQYDMMWFNAMGLHVSLLLSPLSMLFIILTSLVGNIIVLSIPATTSKHVYALVFFMLFALQGVFLAQDGLLFYIFWELALLPISFIGLVWSNATRAISLKFFVYTVLGSLSMLLGLIYVYLHTDVAGAHAWNYNAMIQAAQALQPQQQYFVFWSIFLAFAIKLPLFPFHSWQPATYVEMPYYGTMLLSGIMLKMGVFGIIHWLFAMVPAAIPSVQQPVLILALIGILYASIIAIQQRDYKRLIAYASMAHVGVIVCGLFSAHVQGIQGALFQSVSHGLTVVGLLLVCDILEHRFGSQTISNLGGIRNTHPWFAVLFLCITMGAVALPLTSSFIGEFLIFNGLFSYSPLIMGLAGISVILGAVYMLRSYQGIMLGQHTANTTATIPKAHYILLTVVMALIILLGLFPKPINDLAASAATTLVHTLKPGI